MILQIEDDESMVLKSLIWANYERDRCETVDLFMLLEKGHLYIVPNNGEALKVKIFKRLKGKLLKKSREASFKRAPKEYEGICIDLNLQKETKK